jgi:hypothetical protein
MIVAKTSKIIKIDWINVIIENILYGKFSSDLFLNSKNLLFKYITNKFSFNIKDYKNILAFFDFNKNISSMIKYGFPYYLFLPQFLDKLDISNVVIDYYNKEFYINIYDNQEYIFKEKIIKYNKPTNLYNEYKNILRKIKSPKIIIINNFINNNNYTNNIDFVNFIPKLNFISKLKNYNLITNDLENFKTNFKFNNYDYILNNIIVDNDNRIINNINDNIQINSITYIYVRQNKIINNNIIYNYDIMINKYNDYMANTTNANNENKKLITFIKKINHNINSKTKLIKNTTDNNDIKFIKNEIKNLKYNLNYIIENKKNILKKDYISLIKKIYPYYTYLNKFSKSQLENIYNRVCKNISIKYHKNSCYLDSLLIALFNTNNDYIEKIYINNNNIKKYNSTLYNNGLEIQNELKKIYNIIAFKEENINISNCKNFRKLLKTYYNNYIKIKPNSEKINWISAQNDYFELLNIFNLIFDIPNDLYYKINNKYEYRSFIDVFPIDDLISNTIIHINNFYPKRENVIKFDDITDINYGKIIKHKIEYLKTPILFIYFNRNFNDIEKIDTIIIPTLKLKLKNNDFNLYLNSIIIHLGDVNSGHYITLYECKGIWYKYDDIVNKEELIGSFKDIINNDLYIKNITGLFYS